DTATGVLTAAAAALANAKTAAGLSQTAYTAAGGLVGDLVYTNVSDAVASNITADILSTSALLDTATGVLTAAAAALASAKTAAGLSQTAYTAAGGLVGDLVYTNVSDAVASNITADILSTSALLDTATGVLTAATAA